MVIETDCTGIYQSNYHTSENKEIHNKKHNTMNHICMIDCIISFSEKPQHLSVQSAACHTDAIT